MMSFRVAPSRASETALQPLAPLLLQLYRGARELPRGAFEAFALSRVRLGLRFHAAVWGQGVTDGVSVAATWAHTSEIDPDSTVAWQAFNARDKLIPITLANPDRAVQSHTPSLFPGPDGAVCRDWAARYGCQQVMILSTRDGIAGAGAPGALPVRWLALYRPDPDDAYTSAEHALSDLLMPHLMEALTINRLVDEACPRPPGLGVPAMALADGDGRIRFADEAFRSGLASEWREAADHLPTALMQAIDGRAAVEHVGHRVRIHIRRCADMLLLALQPPTPLDDLPVQRARIANLFADGHSYKAVARMLGLSPSTVRNQIASAYRDLAIGSRGELRALARQGNPAA